MMNMNHTNKFAGFAATLAALAVFSLHAATIPVSWDFGDDAGKDNLNDFTISGTGTTSLQADAARLTISSHPDFENLMAQTQIADLGNGQNRNFTINMTFSSVENVLSENFERIGLLAFSDSASSDNTGIAALLHRGGSSTSFQLRLREGLVGGTDVQQDWTGAVSAGTIFDATLKATYSGPDVIVDFTLRDSNNHSQTLSETFAAASRDGQFFGFGMRGNGGGSGQNMIADFDSFAVIPEPGTLVLLGLSGFALAFSGLRKRRQ